MKIRTSIAIACGAAFFAGCAGQNATPPLTAVSNATNAARSAPAAAKPAVPANEAVTVTAKAFPDGRHKGKLRLVVTIPHRKHHRRSHFVSASTAGMTMSFSGPTNLTQSVGLTPSSDPTHCSGTGASTTCTFTVALLAGSYTGSISTFDKAPVNGNIPGSANLLSLASSVAFSMSGGFINNYTFTLNGVVGSFNAGGYLATDGVATTPVVQALPADADGNTITGTAAYANAVTVSVSETGSTGHATLSLNNGAGQTQVTIAKPGDAVTLNYDGNSPSGYALSLNLHSAAYSGVAASNATIKVTTMSFNPTTLALKGSGDVESVAISESNAPSTPTFSVTSSGCSAIADANTPVSSAGSGTMVVFAREAASSSGCSLNVSDGTTTRALAVSNAYSGSEGSPTVTYYGPTSLLGSGIAAGPNGAMWFAELQNGHTSYVGTIPTTGSGETISEYPLPTPDPVHPIQITGMAPGPDGNMWFAGYSHLIGNIATDGTCCTIISTTGVSNDNPVDILAGPDGNMWFTDPDQATTNYLGRATTGGSVLSAYSVPIYCYPSTSICNGVGVSHAVVGTDGNLWFDETGCASGQVGMMTPSGTLTQYAIDYTSDVTVGSDGNVWFTGFNGVYRVPPGNPAGASMVANSYLPNGNSGPYGPHRLTTGPDGAIWVGLGQPGTDNNYYVERIDPTTFGITTYSIGSGGPVQGMAAGPDGAVWFTGTNGSSQPAIGRIKIGSSAWAVHSPKKKRSKP
jgi:streptogramin lyase